MIVRYNCRKCGVACEYERVQRYRGGRERTDCPACKKAAFKADSKRRFLLRYHSAKAAGASSELAKFMAASNRHYFEAKMAELKGDNANA